MSIDNFEELFKRIDESESIADLFEIDAIPPINFSNEFFFISYSHNDYKLIYKDIFNMQKEGVSVWFDRGMKPGSDWLENAEHFVSQFACKGIVIYLSKASFHSNAVVEEIVLANTYHKPLMPIVIDKDEIIDGDIAETFIKNLSLSDEKASIVRKSFTKRTLWVDASFPFKSKLNYILNLRDDTNLLEIVDLNYDNSPLLINSRGKAKGKLVTQVNDPYCMRLNLPLEVNFIGDATFTNMANLKEINLSHVIEIDSYAFADARQLKEIDLSNIKYIGDSAFERCCELEHIVFPRVKRLQELFDDYDNINLNESYSDENGEFDNELLKKDLKALQDDWYVDDDSAYGEGQQKIPEEDECQIEEHFGKNLFAHCDKLKELELVDTLKEIPEGCFHDCVGLEKAVFDGPNKIGTRAFYNCTKLKHIVFADDENDYEEYEGSYEAQQAIYKERKVTYIGDSAFENCSSLEYFDLPRELKELGSAVFKNAKIDNKYLIIKIPHGPQLFMNSTIESLTFLEVEIADEACRRCTNLKDVSILLYEYSVGASAFRDCSSLKDVSINAVEIKKSAFSHCGVNRLYLEKNIKFVREYAFSTCDNLNYIEVKCEDVQFGPLAFYNDRIDCFCISKKAHIVFDPSSLENADIGLIYYLGEMEDVAEGNLSIIVDYVDDPNTSHYFLSDEEEDNYNKEREEYLSNKRDELMPMIASKIVFYSLNPNYDGRHWRFNKDTGLPEMWEIE